METKEMYFKRQHIIRKLLELLLVNENGNEKEKLKSVQDTTIFYIYYILILDESHTNFNKMKKIMKEDKKEGADLYETFYNCLKGIDILYEAILSEEVDEKRKKDYDKLAKSFLQKLDELCCYVLKNWKIIE